MTSTISFEEPAQTAYDRALRLAAPLDAKRVKQRDGTCGSLSYLETHDVIRTANEIFGFGQWGHEIVDLRPLDGITVTKDGKTGLQVGYVCIVKLTVAGCVPVSGVGYGDAVEYRQSAPVTAHELAVKEAESDALKRALKNYGDQFGLALYDKAAASNGHLDYGNQASAASVGAHTAERGGGDGSTPPESPAASTNSGDWTWPFGKQKGARLADTPAAYLDWFLNNSDKEDIKDRIREFLNLEELAAVGGGSFMQDDDIPFLATIDGLGN